MLWQHSSYLILTYQAWATYAFTEITSIKEFVMKYLLSESKLNKMIKKNETKKKNKHITSDMCFPTWETHIPSDMCSQVGENHFTRDMCLGKHLSL